jgi:hypothetical protein
MLPKTVQLIVNWCFWQWSWTCVTVFMRAFCAFVCFNFFFLRVSASETQYIVTPLFMPRVIEATVYAELPQPLLLVFTVAVAASIDFPRTPHICSLYNA